MAALLKMVSQEFLATVDDFRQKGAIGALRDAALDARDMAAEGGGIIWGSLQGLTPQNYGPGQACLRSASLPLRLSTAQIEFADGRVLDGTVLDVDGVSEPPRAKVMVPGISDPLLVDILAPDVPFLRDVDETPSLGGSLIATLKEEWHATVQDFREKGAVGALKDAAIDAVDLVGSTAVTAVNGARSLAAPLIDLDSDEPASREMPEAQVPLGSEAASPGTGGARAGLSFLEGIKQEIKGTVQDFREKGAVGAMKDAALDAVDIVGSTAAIAVSSARSIAAPLLGPGSTLPDLWATDAPSAAATAGLDAAVSSSVGAPAGAPWGVSAAQAFEADAPRPAKAPEAEATASASVKSTPTSFPSKPVPDSEMPAGKLPEKKSIVSMRRNMFEKPKEDKPKKEEEELID